MPELSTEPALPGDSTEYGVLRLTVRWIGDSLPSAREGIWLQERTAKPGEGYGHSWVVEMWPRVAERHEAMLALDSALIRDFNERNRDPLALVAESLPANLQVTVVRDTSTVTVQDFSLPCGREPVPFHLTLSRVGMNPDRTLALVAYAFHGPPSLGPCGRRMRTPCGLGGYTLLVRAPGRRWTLWSRWVEMGYWVC